MTKYLLDTDICIFFLKGKLGIDKKINAIGKGNCFVSEITIAELMFGASNSNNYSKHQNDPLKILSVTTLKRVLDSLPAYGNEKAHL